MGQRKERGGKMGGMSNSDYELIRDKLHIVREQKKTLMRYIEDTQQCGCHECRDKLAVFLDKFRHEG